MPLKRISGIDPANIIDGSRSKRRKEEAFETVESSSSVRDVEMSTVVDQTAGDLGDTTDVKEEGLRILELLTEAKGKESVSPHCNAT